MSAQPGIFVCVVGPSGAGKDTLLRLARENLAANPDFFFPRRRVTRPKSADEDNAVLSETAFADGVRDGRFALHWRAHGLGYALDADVRAAIAAGHIVVCNISRDSIAAARAAFGDVKIILVTAPLEIIAARLSARGREAPGDIHGRLTRNSEFAASFSADIVIDNSDTPTAGAAELARFLLKLVPSN